MSEGLALTLAVLGLVILLALAWLLWKLAWLVLDTLIEYTEDQWHRTTSTGRRCWLAIQWLLLRLLWVMGWAVILAFIFITVLFVANDIKEKFLDQ